MVTFAGLWTEADDAGRGVANARTLWGRLWSQRDEITAETVEEHLQSLSKSEHILLYEVDAKRYFYILNWEDHTAPAFRRGAPHHPAPPNQDFARGDVQESAVSGKGSGKGREGNQHKNVLTETPEVFPISAALKEWATKSGCDVLDLNKETAKFLDHHASKGSNFKDWDRAWQKWMRQALEWSQPNRRKNQPATSATMRQPKAPTPCNECNEFHPPEEQHWQIRDIEPVKL